VVKYFEWNINHCASGVGYLAVYGRFHHIRRIGVDAAVAGWTAAEVGSHWLYIVRHWLYASQIRA